MSVAWADVKLGDIFEISSSKRVFQKEWQSAGVPFYRAREIVKLAENGTVKNDLFISEELFEEYKVKFGVPKPGDLMVSAVGTLGACYIVQPQDRFYFKDASVLRFKAKRKIYPRFFYHAFKTRELHTQINSSSGSTVKTLTISRAKNINIKIPPFEEQKRIAAILDKADAIRRKRQEAIELADTFLRSVFLKMFGDPVINPMGWDEKSFDDVVLKIVGGWSAKGIDRRPQANEMAVLKISAVTYGVFRPDECKTVEYIPENKKIVIPETGDLLFSRANTRELVGATCVVTKGQENVFLPDKLWRIDCDKDLILPEYVKFLFSHPRFREQMSLHATGTSGSMLNISKKKLLALKVPVPDIKKQKEFAKLFWKMISVSNKLQDATNEINNLFSSLQQRAFRGDL